MSGHSKWATSHKKKEVADAKKGAIFTKLAALITVSAREGGDDLDANFKLRLAVDKAREANMPKDNIDRAIKKGTGAGKDGANFEEITYEIIGPMGIGYIAEAVTDNKNRTVGELKAVVNKNGAQLGSTNSVAWNFRRRGIISIVGNLTDETELQLIDLGAEDIEKNDDSWQVITSPTELMTIAEKIKDLGLKVEDASLAYLSNEEVKITNPEDQEKIERLYNLIDDLDDITNVYTNASW
ncbi:MAG: YebC/PmpR family DNA-binding transcriptional regulator [Candidatus Buchananbacteria bacterium]|jgi:YebC/PmpR family DNA-binding regulatory protein